MTSTQTEVVIVYEPGDLDLVKYIAAGVEKDGISVWYRNPDDNETTDNKPILTCRVFLLILSEESACSSAICDHVALAYIANKPVIPIAVKYYRQISSHLTGGLKLMLAKINWVFFADKEQHKDNLHELCDVIHGFLAQKDTENIEFVEAEQEDTNECTAGMILPINEYGRRIERYDGEDEDEEALIPSTPRDPAACGFWQRHFCTKTSTSWVEFRERFLQDYGDRIARKYEPDTQRVFVNLIYKDILELSKVVTRAKYVKFTGEDDSASPHLFYKRLQHYVIGYFALKEVFDMESTVRLTAVGNLGSFHTHGVLPMLFELVEDLDPNIRAVAALALVKTGRKMRKIEDQLVTMLRDEDRLVRESACLSLGHIRCERATSQIVDRWRNDPIKHVREAAEIALKRMGGEDAKEAIHMTQVLTEEMAYLRSVPKQ